jgi:hypothetical protein
MMHDGRKRAGSSVLCSIEEQAMKRVVLTVVVAAFSGSAFAAADCKRHPKNEWMSEADAKAKIQAQGYRINKFKVDGNCYEIYGTNSAGKKAEIYFDTKTLEVVKAEIEK